MPVFQEACLYASSSLCPEEYLAPHYFVPHSYMGLIASWQVREYVKKSDRWRLLMQALWYVAIEAKSWETTATRPIKQVTICPHDLSAAFSSAWDNADFGTLYSLYAACQEKPKLRQTAFRTLLSAAIRDHTNIGHKYIYVVKAIQLSRDTNWKDPATLYAPIHFMVIAPRDQRLSLAAEARLEPFAEKLGNLAAGQKTIEYSHVMRLRDAITSQEEDILELLVELLAQGYSVESITDSLLLIASHIVYHAPHEDLNLWWVYPVHGFNFTQSVKYELKFVGPRDKVLTILINGLYLREIVRATGKVEVDGSLESLGEADKAGLEQLAEAIENMNVVAALAQVKGLATKGISFTQLAEKLVLLSARNERFLFTHVVKYLYYVLHSLKRSPAPWSDQHLIAFIKFLTLTTKEREVMPVAEEIAKRRPG